MFMAGHLKTSARYGKYYFIYDRSVTVSVYLKQSRRTSHWRTVFAN